MTEIKESKEHRVFLIKADKRIRRLIYRLFFKETSKMDGRSII